MADLKILAPFILSWEGGYCKVKGDRGGATNKGVTLATWRQYGYDKNRDGRIDERDVMLISETDAIERILRPIYWNAWRADEIESQAIANLLVDWVWNSGSYGIRLPQKVLGVKIDGQVGPRTLAAINNHPDQLQLFKDLWHEREDYFRRCASAPSQQRFLAGWLNRLNGIRATCLVCANKRTIKF